MHNDSINDMDIKFYKKEFSYFVIDNYFTPPELSHIWPDIRRLGRNLLSPEETSRAIDDTGVVGKNTGRFITDEPIYYHWCSKKLFRVADPKELYLTKDIHFRYMRNLNFSTVLLNYYEDGDFYKGHWDFSVYTKIVFLYKEPKKFTGGDLHLEDIGDTIECKNNRVVFFPSFATHSVDTVHMKEEDKGQQLGRFSITHFYYVPLDGGKMSIINVPEVPK